MTKKIPLQMAFLAVLLVSTPAVADDGQLVATWNALNVVLPSSQFTPSTPWTAQAMVFNTGRRYADADYNHVWGTPPCDAEGHEWYEADYLLTSGEQPWQQLTSPFSSDEYYLGARSSRWIAVDVTGDIYLRRTFTLENPIAGDLFLACGHDDAPAEYYLNGERVFSATDGWNNDERILLTPQQKALIKTNGEENVLALHVHQNWGGAFADCGLYEADLLRVVELLPTLGAGPWPCCYYLLNSNDELNALSARDWTGRCVDEADWAWGYGPLSNSRDQFLVSYWGSERQPLLLRRHFQLTAGQLDQALEGTIELSCSYDENPKVYLNGTLIWQADGWNDNNYAHCQLTDAQKQLLREGDNVVAVSLMAGYGGGHIDLGLASTIIEQPTAIDRHPPINTHPSTPATQIYNLRGQRLSTPLAHLPKGIYVSQGKKILIAK